jgi:hypothetical protein
MIPIVSVALPSRKRIYLLKRTVSSLINLANMPDEIEICLRLHRDDTETLKELSWLLSHKQVRIVIGDAMRGIKDCGHFWQDAYQICRGKWVWQFQDDAVVETQGWDVAIGDFPFHSILLPAVSKLGLSTYHDDLSCPFIAVPNRSWEKVGIKQFEFAIDDQFFKAYRDSGWKTHFLPITVWHDRRVQPDGTREADEGLC